ncbi:MAG: hypothetical protein H0Z33_16655 [Bacillaceae bacterium]|nr:hypothetical protein [Bacillaceae bacterium]
MRRIVFSKEIPMGDIAEEGGSVRLPRSTLLTAGEYNGIVFTEEELQSTTFPQAFPLTLDHSRSVADEVGWWETPRVEGGKIRATPVINLETTKGNVALGYVKNRMAAGLTPEVSVEVWVDAEERDGKLYATNIEIDKASLVDRGACGPGNGCGIGLMNDEEMVEMGVVPSHPWDYGIDDKSAWSKPTLQDFTDQAWGALSVTEKRDIAGHFAWAPKNPPDKFTDLKLPHHDPSTHAVVWSGVRAAMAALLGARGGVTLPAGDMQKVYAHLAAHYKEFDKTPPEATFSEDGELLEVVYHEGEEELMAKEKETVMTVPVDERAVSTPIAPPPTEEKANCAEKWEAQLQEKDKEIERLNAQLEALMHENTELKAKLNAYAEAERAQLIAKIKEYNEDFDGEDLSIEELKLLAKFAEGIKLNSGRKSFVVSPDAVTPLAEYVETLKKKMEERRD